MGLDYPSVQSVFTLQNIENTADTFNKIRLIENGALQSISEKTALNKAKAPPASPR